MPKSVLRYEVNKDSTLNWKLACVGEKMRGKFERSANQHGHLKYYGMDAQTLSLFLRPKLTVFFSKTGETGDMHR